MSLQKVTTSLLVIAVVSLLVILGYRVKTGATVGEEGKGTISSRGCCGGNSGCSVPK